MVLPPSTILSYLQAFYDLTLNMIQFLNYYRMLLELFSHVEFFCLTCTFRPVLAAFCHGRETLSKICALITGEALLYSMFRENATPITCPFKPPYTFTYNRGHGECRYPVSTIDSCTQDSKIVIQYQACPDVYGSESARK